MANNLYNSMYNPDVLSCIANLSSDEVFTPPEVANAMLDLLPQELFSDPNTTFLDPACKSGVFLREIAKRLLKGLEPLYPDLQERTDHIFKKQLFGIAITELTSHLSRRSLYCSKFANGKYSVVHFDNIDGNVRFKNIKHRWQNGKCVFCGASQKEYDRADDLETHAYEMIHTTKPEEIFNMKFDVIIGNPPYQLNVGSGGKGSGTAVPIYQHFIRQAKKLNPRYLTMIIPSRWFSGGRGLNDFREEMLNDSRIVKIVDHVDSKECFPGVDIAGGICYFLWDRSVSNNNHECSITNISGEWSETKIRNTNEFPVFIRDNRAVDIVRKVLTHNEPTMSTTVYPVSLFGLNTNLQLNEFGNIKVKYSGGFTTCNDKDVRDGKDIINKYKVFIAASSYDHAGQPDKNGQRRIISSNGILPPGTITTSTYIIVQAFDDEANAQKTLAYLKTSFVRFLMSQICISQHISRDTFKFVPQPDLSQSNTDAFLYTKYGINNEEQNYINSIIRPMELGGDE